MIEISTEERGKIIILKLVGEFYIENLSEVEHVWRNIVIRKPRVIAVDCKGITHIDSTAISTLVKFLNEAMTKNIRLIFYDLNPSVQRLFEVARLHRFFTITTRERFESKFCASI
ncbi:MAG: STAS domain-containing protein [Spirochaetes bacterium]|nr:STAS domain-containing protein [Spirochaetota bacterium]